jgi:diguanylate cyclase (GGDEF)-like protein/PAS domain S-box-containing protein
MLQGRALRKQGLLRRVLPFAFVAVVAVVLSLVPSGDHNQVELTWGLILTAVVLAAALTVPWERLPAWAEAGPPLAYFGVVALLREGGGGPESGMAPLVALPVLWFAMYGTRRQLATSILGVAAVLGLPILLLGPATYPPEEIKRAILWLVLSISLGLTVQTLVRTIRGQAERLERSSNELQQSELRVRETAERLEAVLRAATELSVIAIDLRGTITVFNEGAERMLGYRSEEMIGLHTPELIHDRNEIAARARELGVDAGIEAVVELARTGDVETRDWTYIRKDGSRLTVELTVTAAHGEDGLSGYVGLAADVSERRRNEHALQSSEAALAAVSKVAREIATSDDARSAICEAAREVGEADIALILEPDGKGSLVLNGAANADLPPIRVELGAEPSGAAVAFTAARRFFVADAAEHPAVSQRLVSSVGVESVLFEPVVRAGAPVGVLVVCWKHRTEKLDERAGRALQLLAAEAAVAIERDDLLERLREAARTDELTGLANRRTWDQTLAESIARAKRDRHPFCVAMLDLDRFKAYNDERGHQAGDRLLKAAAAAWKAELREIDILARYGGEEFAAVLPGCDLTTATLVLERMRKVVPEGQTCSAGIAEWDGSESSDAVLARADEALYSAKNSGRDTVVAAGL